MKFDKKGKRQQLVIRFDHVFPQTVDHDDFALFVDSVKVDASHVKGRIKPDHIPPEVRDGSLIRRVPRMGDAETEDSNDEE